MSHTTALPDMFVISMNMAAVVYFDSHKHHSAAEKYFTIYSGLSNETSPNLQDFLFFRAIFWHVQLQYDNEVKVLRTTVIIREEKHINDNNFP